MIFKKFVNNKKRSSILDETFITDLLKKQITSLVNRTTGYEYPYGINTLIFTNLINMIGNLICLNFDSTNVCYQTISFVNISPFISSSTLSELYIKVHSVDDCLYLLDGRFDQLRVLNIKIMSSGFRSVSNVNKVDLKSFLYNKIIR